MTDETKTAKPKIPISRILIPALIVLGVLLWLKGYIDWGSVKGLIAFIFILGAAVVIHEFGHFIVAKMLGIRVETFSVGFGPRIWGRKWGTTDYRISAVPLGGYVKLGGDESNAPLEGEGAEDIPLEEQFTLRPRWQKFLVAVAGPVMNILTALAIPFASGLIWGVPVTPTSPIVSRVMPNSAAAAAGIQRGDRIVAFNGEENPAWDDIRGDIMVVENQPKPREFVVERNGQRIPITVTPTRRREGTDPIGDVGILPDYGVAVPVTIRAVTHDSPAARAGLQPGDRLVAINGETIRNRDQATGGIFEIEGSQVQLTVERDGKPVEISSSLNPPKDEAGKAQPRLGVEFTEVVPREKVGVGGAASYATRYNVQILKLTGKALKQLFVGDRSARDTLSGPLGIYEAAATSVNEAGWGGVFSMLGFLSLSLGVFNLLPIPVLDGGAIFLLLVEAVLALGGWKLSMRVRERIQQVGFVMLLLLMGFVITNDVLKKVSPAKDESPPPPAATAPNK
ncbi:MAG TPA: RIP metalloprotease RseP [Pyrinomonadaceae bacterium]|nr:RIP metalloprotease RseP [Pyrinomonadaceae bacterium]